MPVLVGWFVKPISINTTTLRLNHLAIPHMTISIGLIVVVPVVVPIVGPVGLLVLVGIPVGIPV